MKKLTVKTKLSGNMTEAKCNTLRKVIVWKLNGNDWEKAGQKRIYFGKLANVEISKLADVKDSSISNSYIDLNTGDFHFEVKDEESEAYNTEQALESIRVALNTVVQEAIKNYNAR